ncbi:sporulation integral membrane protein YlbJ, partial [Clostridioides difficile]|nr:sporulation integral membrane protein YlbJ [Clostridioides difficile]
VSSITSSPEILRASLASFLIGFSGLSILAQCCTFLSKTDIDLKLYILSKFAHGVLAAIFIFILYPIANSAVLVSSFADTYNVIYNNLIWFYYLSYYDTILQIVVIIYLISAV